MKMFTLYKHKSIRSLPRISIPSLSLNNFYSFSILFSLKHKIQNGEVLMLRLIPTYSFRASVMRRPNSKNSLL